MVRSWQVCSFENPSGFYEISRNGRGHFCFCFESSGGRTSADFPYYPLGFDICDVIGTEAYTVEAAMFAFPFVLQTFCKQFNVESNKYRKVVSRSTCYYSENQVFGH